MSGLPESRSGFGLCRLWALLFAELVALAKWGCRSVCSGVSESESGKGVSQEKVSGAKLVGQEKVSGAKLVESGKGVRSQIGGSKRCQEPNWWVRKGVRSQIGGAGKGVRSQIGGLVKFLWSTSRSKR